jgi:hypothetical protein
VAAFLDRRAASVLLPAAAAALVRPRSLEALREPQMLNPYSYAVNNPGAYRDPSGLNCGVYVQIGWEPYGDGLSESGGIQISGTINNFNHWLQQNQYTLQYEGGSYATISDNGTVVGAVDATQAGFTPFPYQETPSPFSAEFWRQTGAAVTDVGQSLWGKFGASVQVPWHKLQGQEYWDAANNPENYIEK